MQVHVHAVAKASGKNELAFTLYGRAEVDNGAEWIEAKGMKIQTFPTGVVSE